MLPVRLFPPLKGNLRPSPDMPEVVFTIQLPDGMTKECYSPSTIVHRHFREGEEMSVEEFLARSRKAFPAASERVRAKFGFACSSATAHWQTLRNGVALMPAMPPFASFIFKPGSAP